jgi:glucose uptake protein GlcU
VIASDVLNIILGIIGVFLVVIGWMVISKQNRDQKTREQMWKKLNGHTDDITYIKSKYVTDKALEKYVELKNAVLITKIEALTLEVKRLADKI